MFFGPSLNDRWLKGRCNILVYAPVKSDPLKNTRIFAALDPGSICYVMLIGSLMPKEIPQKERDLLSELAESSHSRWRWN